jgi:hypothetical protein
MDDGSFEMSTAMNEKSTRLGFPLAACGFTALVVLGFAALIGGAIWGSDQFWANLLLVSYYLLGIGLGGSVLLALFWVTGARWCATIRRPLEKLIALLPAGVAGVAIVFIAHPAIYPWSDQQARGYTESTFHAIWLERRFFLVRALIYVTLWLTFALTLVLVSRREDTPDPRSPNAKKVRVSAAFLVVFVLTFWLASTDWIMSLEPKWSSAVFGVYQFSGMFVSALAAVIVLVIWLDWQGTMHGKLTRNQLRDLGTLLFAFSSFWMYIWFSQYLLIWYVNIPEEAEYFVVRQRAPWQSLLLVNLVLSWGVPFVVLLFRRAKECSPVLLAVAVVVLVGRWLDLYLTIVPPVAGVSPDFGAWDVGLLVGAIGLAALILTGRSSLQRTNLSAVA